MLRASKVYNGAIRSNLLSKPTLGTSVIKRCESTVSSEETKKKSGSIFKKLMGTTLLLASGYGGATYYALNDKNFYAAFTAHIPGAKESVEFADDFLKNYNSDEYLVQTSAWKKHVDSFATTAKDFGIKLQETAQDYASSAYSTLTGQENKADTKLIPAEKVIEKMSSTTDTVTSIQITSDKESQPAVLEVAVEKPKPIEVKLVSSDNAIVCELSQIVVELASILNQSGLSGLGRDIIEDAEKKIQALNERFLLIDREQDAILKALKQLKTKGDQVEGNLEAFRVESLKTIENAHTQAASTIVAREAQLKNQFEQTRAEMKTTFAQQLAADLNTQQEVLEQARAKALLAQASELQRLFVKEVKLLVEQERAGRLAQLDNVSQRFKALEQYTLQNAKALDNSRQYHVIHITLGALHDSLNSQHKQSFADEFQALSHNTKDDHVIQTVLSAISKETAEQGISTLSELVVRFEEVSNEIRHVALVPENGGFGSHIISFLMSYLLFKKSGLVEGDDVESVLARTEYYLKTDHLEFATRELNQLVGWPKKLATDWIQSARRHLEVKQALELRNDVFERLKDSLTIIVLGASGDLAKKKTFPAIFALYKDGFLPKNTKVVGYARSDLGEQEFHKHVQSNLDLKEEDLKKKSKEFIKLCTYVRGKYDEDESFKKLDKYLSESEEKRGLTDEQKNRIFYMALPPSVYIEVSKGLSHYVRSKKGKNSLVIEKPFGKDSKSAAELVGSIKKLFKEEEVVYRIDHYLGKELLKNILNFRFANMIFGPLWNKHYIDSVQITLKESFGCEGRGGYFDEYGVIRDVIQNHLLQLFSIVAMERPIKADSESIRDEKVKLLRSVKPLKLEDCLLGQYEKNGNKPGYTDDETVPDDSLTATFGSIAFFIDNERWDSVPFILKSGKALDNDKAEVRIQFKKVPGSLFSGEPKNELVFRVQPGEAIYMKFNSKVPGFSTDNMITELDLTYKTRYNNLNIPAAYETLILDVMRGDHSNFVRDDELIAAWDIFTPLLHQIENDKIKPEPYKYGSRGPKKLNGFSKKYNIERLDHEDYQWPKHNLKD
ncbi:glucose-6-phosphate dehydrogenase [Sporodiniella umbellata]|nr:glucose-6-phosphate dehydrogenase [Sporodiniella umbellata]